MDPFTTGINRTLRGLRTGDRNSILIGAALLAYAYWQRQRNRAPTRELVYRQALKPGQAVVIKGARANDPVPGA